MVDFASPTASLYQEDLSPYVTAALAKPSKHVYLSDALRRQASMQQEYGKQLQTSNSMVQQTALDGLMADLRKQAMIQGTSQHVLENVADPMRMIDQQLGTDSRMQPGSDQMTLDHILAGSLANTKTGAEALAQGADAGLVTNQANPPSLVDAALGGMNFDNSLLTSKRSDGSSSDSGIGWEYTADYDGNQVAFKGKNRDDLDSILALTNSNGPGATASARLTEPAKTETYLSYVEKMAAKGWRVDEEGYDNNGHFAIVTLPDGTRGRVRPDTNEFEPLE